MVRIFEKQNYSVSVLNIPAVRVQNRKTSVAFSQSCPSGRGGCCPVDLGCPHLGKKEPGSPQFHKVARPEEGSGLPQVLLFICIFFVASSYFSFDMHFNCLIEKACGQKGLGSSVYIPA